VGQQPGLAKHVTMSEALADRTDLPDTVGMIDIIAAALSQG
jgi:hypothetical protein